MVVCFCAIKIFSERAGEDDRFLGIYRQKGESG
jgi:hypothetical protein